ncbi:hypothetical protein [Sphingosinicella sp. BN140058]|uniref:hypothetical protein n=1 Tax=Sphingosinicella sp. BN140058 TaxID=1892855 RepID=UPI0013EB74B4|nr:hypothetical protein [Sphingosinicella sp. BN140058]
MLFVANSNLIALGLGLLIGLVVAFWIFKLGRKLPPQADQPSTEDRPGPNETETPLP